MPIPDAARRPGSSRGLGVLFLLTLAVLAVALFTARAMHPGPDAGEFWSDSNVINGCRGYDQIGFTATWGLPRIQLAAPPDDTRALYLSYPPGPYWLSYAAWSAGRALGVDPVLAARLVAQTCGLGSGLLIFLVCSRLARSTPIGALAGLFYILSPAFLSYSAALHHMAYSPLLLLGAMRAWLAFEDGRGPRRTVWLALTALLFAADCWTNLEHMFFFSLFVGVRTLFHFRWPVVLGAILVGPIPVPMMALRVLHNAQVLGGWDAAMEKFRSSASRRSTGGRLGVDLANLARSWLARLDWPVPSHPGVNLDWNQEFVYPAANPWVLAGVVALLVSLALHRMIRSGRNQRLPLSLIDPARVTMPPLASPHAVTPAKLLCWTLPPASPIARGLAGGALLLLGGLTWFVVMTQHTQPHRFIVLLLMPGLCLLLGTLAWWMIDSARTSTAGLHGPVAAWIRTRGWVLAALLLGVFAAQARRADVLNQLAPLDSATRQRVLSRQEFNARVNRVGNALARDGVTRVHLYDGTNVLPWQAASIGLPFLYARLGIPEAIQPSDAVLAKAWDDSEIAACLGAAERFGLPDLASRPEDRTLIFRSRPPGAQDDAPHADLNMSVILLPGQSPAAPASTPADTALTLRSLRWAPTVLGDQFALALFCTGDLARGTGPNALDRFAFSLRIRSPDGRVLHESRSRLAWAPIRDDRRALLFLVVPASILVDGATADLAIWDRQARAPVFFPAQLPTPLTRTDSGTRLRWPAQPTRTP